MKTCTTCKKPKPLADFCKFKLSKDGLSYMCKPCNASRGKDYYRRNRKEIIKKRTEYAKEHPYQFRQWVFWRCWDKRNGFHDTLSKEEFKRITSMPCHYCGFAGKVGLDRIDNAKGHAQFNCLPCCDWCNTARSDHFTVHETMLIGKAIAQIRKTREAYASVAIVQ